MRRILLLSLILSTLPVLAPLVPAQAGTGSANSCTDGSENPTYTTEYPIITSPITLALQVNNAHHWYPYEPQVRLCYSTSPAGYGGGDTTGGSIDIGQSQRPYSGDFGRPAECKPQSNSSGVTTYCNVGEPTYWLSFPPTNVPNDGYTQSIGFSIPITFCLGSCTSVNPGQNVDVSVGRTTTVMGIWTVRADTVTVPALSFCANGTCQSIVSSNEGLTMDPIHPTAGPPPGTTTGSSTTAPATSACVEGTCQAIVPSGITAGVGVNKPETTCNGMEWYPCGLIYNRYEYHAGTTIAAVQVGSTVIPVTSPARFCLDMTTNWYPYAQNAIC